MKFTKIRRLITLPEYENISLECEIEDGETVDDVDFILRTRLSGMVTDQQKRRELCHEISVLQYQKELLQGDIDKIRKWIKINKPLLREFGFDDLLDDDIPF